MCFVEIHEMDVTSITKTLTESKQTKTYSLGQKLLRHITKIPIFALKHDKNAFSRKLKDRFSPPLMECCLRCTLGLLSQNNIAPRVERGANLFLLDTMAAWREIENCIEMPQHFCPGL